MVAEVVGVEVTVAEAKTVVVDVVVTAGGDKMVAVAVEVKMVAVEGVRVEVEAEGLGKVPHEGIVEVPRPVVEVAGIPEAEESEAEAVGMLQEAEAV